MEKFSETQKQTLIDNLARAFSALSHQHTKGYTVSDSLPSAMARKLQMEMETYDRTMGNIIAQCVVETYEETVEKGGRPNEIMAKIFQKSTGTDYLERIGNEIAYQWSRLANLIGYQEQQYEAYDQLTKLDGYHYYLFLSEQTATTCRGCLEKHGKVYTKEELQGLNMIPPIHRNCQCSLVAMDNWLYGVYNRNQREMLPYMTQLIGTQDGLFYVDHSASQLGINNLTLRHVSLGTSILITHQRTSGSPLQRGLENLKRDFVAWGTQFGQDAVAALETLMAQGEMRLQQATLEENLVLSLLLYADFFALTVPSSAWNSAVNRTSRWLDDPSLFNGLNCLTMGLGDVVNGVFFPEEPWSFEHISNMIGLGAILYGSYRMGETLVDVPERLPMPDIGIDDVNELSQAKISEIISAPNGQRPDPSTYLSDKYIQNHLAQFENGVTKITSQIPASTIGPPGGTFVMPSSYADDIILKAGGDVHKLEELLGLAADSLGTNPVRIDVSNPSGLRMPTGNERGANSYWIPGGYTSGGIPEATIEPALASECSIDFIK